MLLVKAAEKIYGFYVNSVANTTPKNCANTQNLGVV